MKAQGKTEDPRAHRLTVLTAVVLVLSSPVRMLSWRPLKPSGRPTSCPRATPATPTIIKPSSHQRVAIDEHRDDWP